MSGRRRGDSGSPPEQRDRGGGRMVWRLALLLVPLLAVGFILVQAAASRSSGGEVIDVPAEVLIEAKRAGSAEVDHASVDLGQVPLDVIVTHDYRISNVGAAPVSLGKPRIEVLEGC